MHSGVSAMVNPEKRDPYFTNFTDIIGRSRAIQNTIADAQRAAHSDSNVIIFGASGTGKEMVARSIHFQGGRRSLPFIPINCGAIPDELLESELFGHEKGAFTGAYRTKIGKFEAAGAGTVFLDEISEMALRLQVKLLRAIQEKEICRIGGNEVRHSNFRTIAATNVELTTRIKNGQFREDLFYRLNVIPIYVPSLCERKEDIILLANHFLTQYQTRLGKNVNGISEDAKALLLDYHWPGNVRELQNIIEYAVGFAPGPVITREVIEQRITVKSWVFDQDLMEHVDSLSEYQRSAERRLFEFKLKVYGEDRSNAVDTICRDLKISRATFYRKVKELGINLHKMA